MGLREALPERFSLFDQQTCSLHSRLGFRRGMPFNVHKWGDKRYVKLNLLATHARCGRQSRDLV